ncbi:MAG: hypothetical protein VZQ83_08330 [Eubacterium sp.]|nr:hypothetical protein [Eubacterium sp.]
MINEEAAQTMYGKCVDLRDTTKSSGLSLVIEKDGVGTSFYFSKIFG